MTYWTILLAAWGLMGIAGLIIGFQKEIFEVDYERTREAGFQLWEALALVVFVFFAGGGLLAYVLGGEGRRIIQGLIARFDAIMSYQIIAPSEPPAAEEPKQDEV